MAAETGGEGTGATKAAAAPAQRRQKRPNRSSGTQGAEHAVSGDQRPTWGANETRQHYLGRLAAWKAAQKAD